MKNTNLGFNAGDRNRTGTGIATHRILSPGRLPVPPRRHLYYVKDNVQQKILYQIFSKVQGIFDKIVSFPFYF